MLITTMVLHTALSMHPQTLQILNHIASGVLDDEEIQPAHLFFYDRIIEVRAASYKLGALGGVY